MKLLYITNGINGSGGLERVLSIKAGLLAEDFGYEVHIVVLNEVVTKPFYRFSAKLIFHNVAATGNPLSYTVAYIKGMRAIVQQIQPDLISVCDDGLKGFFLPKIITKRVPIIYERHASIHLSDNSSLKDRFRIKMMRYLSRTFSKFVVLTNANKNEWPHKNNLVAIPNPVSFYPDTSSSLHNNKVIVVGSHSFNKGYDMLLNAWKLIVKQNPDWELHIYGKLDRDTVFVKMANKLKLSASVFFHQPQQDIVSCYLDASLLVLSSRTEGFGMVLIEAMACGLPCISFDCPSGPGDIISHGEDGLLVPKGDREALAEALLLLMNNKALRHKMGKKAKENIKRFLPEPIVKQWDVLFKSLVE